MEFAIESESIESIDNSNFGLMLSCLVLQRDDEGLSKIAPFLLKMSEKKIKTIWKKISQFLTFEDKKWFKSFIKDFLGQL